LVVAGEFVEVGGAIVMVQQGQVLRMKSSGADGRALWAYRYRVGGRGSRRVQHGGFASEQDACEALERALERLRRANGTASALTLSELVNEYLAQHDAQPETIEKLSWLLTKAVCAFGDRRLGQLRPQEIAAWRMMIPPGHRFEATQALRHVLTRTMQWGMIDVNPATHGVDNPQRRRTEKRPFESRLGDCYGPLVLFAAATGLRPGEWIALERRDIDVEARVVYVRRAFRNGRPKSTKTEGSIRAVPLQAIALQALAQLPVHGETDLLFPSPRGSYFDLHNFHNRDWKPAQLAVGIAPPARLRSATHVRNLRAPCCHLHLRSVPLHGRKPDDDRPPLRSPGPRRTRPRNRAARRLYRVKYERRPRRGRHVDAAHASRRLP
jgi:integrase